MKTIAPKKVNFTRNDSDFEAVLLAKYGFSTRHITSYTGLSSCQVSYRLRRAQTKRSDYRNGESGEAQRIMQWVRRGAVDMERLRKNLAQFNTKARHNGSAQTD